jgi:hypothetical protein
MINIKKPGRRALAAVAVLATAGLAAELAPAAAQAATVRPASYTTTEAAVYSDQWEDGYRGWTEGGLVMLCWADGAWADGTNRWFAVYAGSISGFVNADLVHAQTSVPECS